MRLQQGERGLRLIAEQIDELLAGTFELAPGVFDAVKLLLFMPDFGLEFIDDTCKVSLAGEGDGSGVHIVRLGLGQIVLGFQLAIEAFGLVGLRHFRFFRGAGEVGPEAVDVRQPAAGERASTGGEVFTKGLDDVGHSLVVGGAGDDHRWLAAGQRGFGPQGGNYREQQRGFAGTRRAVDG